VTRCAQATAHSSRAGQWVAAGLSLERRLERDEERRSKLYSWRIVPISTAALPLIDSDGPRMPPPSQKSTFQARCFLTGQRGWRREQQLLPRTGAHVLAQLRLVISFSCSIGTVRSASRDWCAPR